MSVKIEPIFRRWFGVLLDILWPPRCPVTDEVVAVAGQLSAGAWSAIDFLGPPECAICGIPFEYDQGTGAICGACAADPPQFDKARSVLRYDGVGRDLVLAFKHADRTQSAELFGTWMAGRLSAAAAGGDPNVELIVVPVPLHWRSIFKRRYNQSALLAYALARELGRRDADRPVAVVPDLLVRVRNTPVQGGNRTERLRNIRRAFALRRRVARVVPGATILLVDDVHTTGATLSECARTLKEAGAASVYALTLARVVHNG